MTDIELLALPSIEHRTYGYSDMRDYATEYARANVEHHTAPLHAEIERLRDCLKTANSNHEQFERKWYLAQDRAESAEAQRDMLAEALREAREDIESWAGYASPYFQEKHDLAGTLAKYDEVLTRASQPRAKEPGDGCG